MTPHVLGCPPGRSSQALTSSGGGAWGVGAHRFPGRVSSASAHLHPKDPPDGLIVQQGVLHPRSPGQSLSHWGGASAVRGLWGGRGWQGLTPPSTASGTAEGWLAGHSLSLPGLKEDRSALCSVHFRLSGGSQAMRGGHGLCGQEAALGPMARTQQLVWALPPGHLHLGLPASPLSCVPFTQWTLEHWSLLCHSRPGQERRGRLRSSPPLIGHRDVPNVFILVKRKVKTTLHCIQLAP